MNFLKNDMLDAVLERNYKTCSMTLNTRNFIAVKDNKRIMRILMKTFRKQLRRVNKDYRKVNPDGLRVRIRTYLQQLKKKFRAGVNHGERAIFRKKNRRAAEAAPALVDARKRDVIYLPAVLPRTQSWQDPCSPKSAQNIADATTGARESNGAERLDGAPGTQG